MFQFTNKEPEFWVQLKGENAGKPLRKQIPNSVGIKTNPELMVSDFLFITLEYLFSVGAFKPFLKGSVIPYIRNEDIVKVLVIHWTAFSGNYKPYFFIQS